MFNLTREDMASALLEIGSHAVEAGKIIDLCIYGGSCLMLVSNFREASRDVDAVAMTDQTFIDRIAHQIAGQRGWPDDWLNDGVNTFLSPNVDQLDEHSLWATYPSEQRPGLRVYTPPPEYMLAMKLMAMRIDEPGGGRDYDDIINLMRVVNISRKTDLIKLAAQYYPVARVSTKLLLAADELVKAVIDVKRTTDVSPAYNRRASSGRDGR